MKFINADLTASVGGTYDQTRTTIQGRVFQKTIDGEDVLGPPLNKYVDVVADTTNQVIPILSHLTSNGRLFSIGGETNGFVFISLHEMNMNTGAMSYVGVIRAQLAEIAATTTVIRGFKVLDNPGSTGWRIFIATTASILINGGTFCVNNVDKADFISVGFTAFDSASGLNQKATYLLQTPTELGVNTLNVQSAGLILDPPNSRVYVHNGVSTAHQYYAFDASASLNCPTQAGVIDAGTDRVTIVGHGFLDNDPVLLTNLVGGAALTNNTKYFVRNSTVDDFQLSATTGGAAINITTNGTVDVCRAFGSTADAFVFKTGNLPTLVGTLLLTNSEYRAIPQHTSNAGNECIFFATSSTLYLGAISELSSGVTAWPSLVGSNLLGTVNQITTPTALSAVWSDVLDKAIYITATSTLVMKPIQNNTIDKIFGGVTNSYLEGFTSDTINLQLNALISNLDIEDGWIVATSNATVGQRGCLISDIKSDELFDYSYIVTKVLDTPSSAYKFVTTLDKLFAYTGSLKVFYRTSGFGSISGGWLEIPFSEDLSGITTAGTQVQFKISFDTLGLDTSIPAQLCDFILGLSDLNSISNNWEYTHDDTNPATNQVTYRLKKSYSSFVPNLRHTVRDLSDTLVANHTTAADGSFFEYSTDNGVNWLSLGTIPNVVGTLIRYTNNSLPSQELRPALQEA